MTLASTKHTVVVPNSSSLISGSNIAPGESFWFNTSNGNSYFSQSVIANKLSGSLQTLADGVTQAFIAGPGIIVGFQDNGQVAISSSISAPESFWYSDFSATIKTTGSFQASGSGVVKQDLNVSGNTAVNRLWVTASSGTALSVSGASSFAGAASFTGGLSGSLQRTTSGLSYLIGSGNITIDSQSNGQVAVSVSFGAPADASYLALSTNATLTNERVFTPGVGIGVVDGGANGTYTVSASLRAGPNITINTEGNTLVITGAAGGGGGSSAYTTIVLHKTITHTINSIEEGCAGVFHAAEHDLTGGRKAYFRAVLRTNDVFEDARVSMQVAGMSADLQYGSVTYLATNSTAFVEVVSDDLNAMGGAAWPPADGDVIQVAFGYFNGSHTQDKYLLSAELVFTP